MFGVVTCSLLLLLLLFLLFALGVQIVRVEEKENLSPYKHPSRTFLDKHSVIVHSLVFLLFFTIFVKHMAKLVLSLTKCTFLDNVNYFN